MSLTLCGSGNRVYRIAGECQDLGSNIGLNGVYSHPQSLKKKKLYPLLAEIDTYSLARDTILSI